MPCAPWSTVLKESLATAETEKKGAKLSDKEKSTLDFGL